jgi:hypothetical protein
MYLMITIIKEEFFETNNMTEKEIDVNDYIDVSAMLKQLDIENAKQVLRDAGYYVDNLWQTQDVFARFECTEQEAQMVLDQANTDDIIQEKIWNEIGYCAENMNLKPIE